MPKLTANGELKFPVNDTGREITVYISGDAGGGEIQIFGMANGLRARVANGGPFNEVDDVDQYEQPIKRIVLDGNAHEIAVVLTGANTPNLDIEVI